MVLVAWSDSPERGAFGFLSAPKILTPTLRLFQVEVFGVLLLWLVVVVAFPCIFYFGRIRLVLFSVLLTGLFRLRGRVVGLSLDEQRELLEVRLLSSAGLLGRAV